MQFAFVCNKGRSAVELRSVIFDVFVSRYDTLQCFILKIDVASWVNLYLADSQASTQSKKIEFGSVACLNITNIQNVDFNRKQLLEKTN